MSITLSVNGGLANFAPIAIGITLTVRALGIVTTGMAEYADIRIYLVANFAAGALSAFVFNFNNGSD